MRMEEHEDSRKLSISIEDGLSGNLCDVEDPLKSANRKIRCVHVYSSILGDESDPQEIRLCLSKCPNLTIFYIIIDLVIKSSSKVICRIGFV